MKRDLYLKLLRWKDSGHRKPLILRGARQTGKTHLLETFGAKEYRQCHYFNFEEDAQLASLFTADLDTTRIIRDLSLYGKCDIRQGEDLIVFDEIQECNSALNSLKYFNERDNAYHIASAGSLLGVRMSKPKSFPVGKVDFLDLYPMTFYEFLDAIGQEGYRGYLEALTEMSPIPDALHHELIGFLKQYYHVGGMPEAVGRYVEDPQPEHYRRVQKAILDSYVLDFAKHAPSSDIPKLSLVWNSLPAQLARENKKFLFSMVKQGARAREYENALSWLEQAGLIHRASLVASPRVPLVAYQEMPSFKLYACDVGLLGALANVPSASVQSDLSIFSEYKGAFVENYIAQHLVEMAYPLHYWKNIGRDAEVDFLIQHGAGILPIEVKSGVNVRSKSLAFYSSKYPSEFSLRTSLRNFKQDNRVLNIPLYAIQSLPQFLSVL